MEHDLKAYDEPMAKRDTRNVSEEIVRILNKENYSASEQKEILNNARNYLIEMFSEKRDSAAKEMEFYKQEIETIVSK